MKSLSKSASLFLLIIINQIIVGQEIIRINTLSKINEHADQVGIWINTITDNGNAIMEERLAELNMKSLRYGYQYGGFDINDLSSQIHIPNDDKTQGYLAHDGRIIERIGPEGVGQLAENLGIPVYGIINTDLVNYIGTEDAGLAAMTREEKLDSAAQLTTDWVNWGKVNQFTVFEIGNENDLKTSEGSKNGVIELWTPQTYAEVAMRLATEIKSTNPDALCSINGGLESPENNVTWFREISEAQPTLKDKIDFLTAHKYEFWLDYENWKLHPEYDLGRLSSSIVQSTIDYFDSKPIHVTEIGGWDLGDEGFQHYRAVLGTEMLGNIFIDKLVEHVQFWPTRWASMGGVFKNAVSDYQYTSMGNGLLAYTKFAEPIMTTNNHIGSIRYFASRDFDNSDMSIWLINHAENTQSALIQIEDFDYANISTKNEVWRLTSDDGNPSSTKNSLYKDIVSVSFRDEGNLKVCDIDLPPTSVTIIRLSHDIVETSLNETDTQLKLFPNPVENKLYIDLQGISHIDVIDLQGKTIYSADNLHSSHELNTESLNTGIYYLQAYTVHGVVRQKFIKD